MVAILVLASSATSFAQDVPQTDSEKAFYSIGASMAAQLEQVKPIAEAELDILVQGFRDGINEGTLAVEQQEGAKFIQALLQERP